MPADLWAAVRHVGLRANVWPSILHQKSAVGAGLAASKVPLQYFFSCQSLCWEALHMTSLSGADSIESSPTLMAD